MSALNAYPRRLRPQSWIKADGAIGCLICLMVVTVAWLNLPASPWRLSLAVFSWAAVLWVCVEIWHAAQRGKAGA